MEKYCVSVDFSQQNATWKSIVCLWINYLQNT